ncbi:MAG: hypothetical protein LBP88_08415 [Treponema sp.]|nr:hypothetical protein [Treponema sp.]
MNNFIADYLKNEIGSKRKDAIDEWIRLKELNIPKDYKSWKLYILKNKIMEYGGTSHNRPVYASPLDRH